MKNSSNDYDNTKGGIANLNDMHETHSKSWRDIESQYWRSVYVVDYWQNDSEAALSEC